MFFLLYSLKYSARVYEEEDFQPAIYKFDLCYELSDQRVVSMMKDCENDIQKRFRDIDATSEAYETLNAVFNRIKFTRMLLQSLLLLFPTKLLSPNEAEMAEITKLLTSALELLPNINKTIERGTKPDVESMLNEKLIWSFIGRKKMINFFWKMERV